VLIFQLEQMEIETREIPLKDRDRYQMRLKSYHSELSKLETDLVCFEFTFCFSRTVCYSGVPVNLFCGNNNFF